MKQLEIKFNKTYIRDPIEKLYVLNILSNLTGLL